MVIDFGQQLRSDQPMIYLFSTTPPSLNISASELSAYADQWLKKLQPLQYDGLIVYDIQDESCRIETARPFPYKKHHDTILYAKLLQDKSAQAVIAYHCVAQTDAEAFQQWLNMSLNEYKINNLVLVGSPSSALETPLSIMQAYQLLAAQDGPFIAGAVTIAERHHNKQDEPQRLLHKSAAGCDFFVSQAVYDAQLTIDLINDYALVCQQEGVKPKRIILTFSPCGGEKALAFIRWLGVAVPDDIALRIIGSATPLQESIEVCQENLSAILQACQDLEVPLGLNIESVVSRESDLDAAVSLLQTLQDTVKSFAI
ncbi:MAG: hypothetical protein HRU20_20140 [Pseudomonadales bacterium]|nr:hypothetical protein [Pseudomonadales bacterium]